MTFRAEVKNVFHNAETGGFEADVTFRDAQLLQSYSVFVEAPISMDFDTLRPKLITAAETVRAKGPADLRRRSDMRPKQARRPNLLDQVLFAQPSYLDQILSRAA